MRPSQVRNRSGSNIGLLLFHGESRYDYVASRVTTGYGAPYIGAPCESPESLRGALWVELLLEAVRFVDGNVDNEYSY